MACIGKKVAAASIFHHRPFRGNASVSSASLFIHTDITHCFVVPGLNYNLLFVVAGDVKPGEHKLQWDGPYVDCEDTRVE